MKQYIDKSALEAEIEKRRSRNSKNKLNLAAAFEDNYLLSFIDTLEVKRGDLEKEFNSFLDNVEGVPPIWHPAEHMEWGFDIAKHFFELGTRLNNPITAADRGMAEEIIINLKRVEQDYHIDLTREMEWLRSKAKKGE